MGAAGLERARTEFSVARMADRTLALYELLRVTIPPMGFGDWIKGLFGKKDDAASDAPTSRDLRGRRSDCRHGCGRRRRDGGRRAAERLERFLDAAVRTERALVERFCPLDAT